jgi:hypothetical protein
MPKYQPDLERIVNLAVELQDAIGYDFPWEISSTDKLCLSHTTVEQILQAIDDLKQIRTTGLDRMIQRIKQVITNQTNNKGRK